MAGGAAALTFTIAANLEKGGFKEAAEHMRQLQNSIEDNKKATEGWGDIVNKVKDYFTLASIGEFYKFAIEKAMEAERAQRNLQLRVEAAGMAWERSGEQINAVNEALAAQSRFDKSDLDSAMTTLIDRTNNVAVSQKNLQLAMALSVVTGESLAATSDKVGLAAAGNEKATMQLAKQFGITGEKAKDAEFVLGTLAKRYESMATSTEGADGKLASLKKTFADLAETVGNFWLPVLNAVMDGTSRFLKSLQSLTGALAGVAAAIGQFLVGNWGDAKDAFNAAGLAAKEAWGYIAGEDPTGGGDNAAKKAADAASKVRTVYVGLTEELKQLIKDAEKERAKVLADGLATDIERENARYAYQRDEVRKMADFKKLNAEDQAKVLEAIEAQHQANLTRVHAQQMEKRLQMAVRVGNLMGVATAKMMRGEKDAWKDMLSSVIDMVVQEAQAQIIINGMKGFWQEVGKGGWVGAVSGAGILAMAAAQAAAVGAVGELAKGALTGGGGGSASMPSSAGGGGGIFGGATTTTSSEVTPERKQATVQVNIQGDMYGEPAFVDRLAAKISEAVENRDVRLISSGGK